MHRTDSIPRSTVDKHRLSSVHLLDKGVSHGQTENCAIYYNTEQSTSFQKQCSQGYAGSYHTYTVPAGTYSSTVGVPEANTKASADITANGQAYADAMGTCTATCSYTPSSGYNIVTSGISLSGSTVTFYIVFYRTSNMTVGNNYHVATINGGCRPSTTRTINYSSGGRTWIITIYPSGQMYFYLQSGPTVNAYSTTGTSTLNYNL